MSKSRPIVEMRNLSFSYSNGEAIVRNFSKSFGRDRRIGIVGLSGSGKTTLLKLLAGQLCPSSGEIIRAPEIDTDRGGRFGFIPQQDGLLPWRTVLENLRLGRPPSSSLLRSDAAGGISALGLPSEILDAYPVTLSVGMRKRVEIVRACLALEGVLLADEPFSGLDSLATDRAWKHILSAAASSSATIVVVLHELTHIAFHMDEVIVFAPDRSGELKVLDNPVRGVPASAHEAEEFRLLLAREAGVI